LPVLAFREANKRLAGGDYPRHLLLQGEEFMLGRELINTLKKSLSSEAALVDYLEWEEGSNESDLYTSLATLPLRADKRLVVLNNPGVEAIRSVLLINNPVLVLVILCNKKIKASDQAYKKILKDGWIVDCSPLKGPDLTGRLQEEARSRHKELPENAAQYLRLICGDNLGQLTQEIEKAAVYLGDKSLVISESVLKEIGSRTVGRSIFELADAVSSHRSDLVKSILADLLQQGQPPVLLVNLVSKHFLQLLEVACLLKEGVDPQKMSEVMEIHPYAAKKMVAQVCSISQVEIEKILDSLLDLDQSIKKGKGSPQLLMEATLSEICMKKPPAVKSKRQF
jgi:DNA polymerase-3 subunit delta